MKRLIVCLLLIVMMVGTVSADTLLVYTSGTEDGYVYRAAADTFSNIRGYGGTDVDTTGSTAFAGLTGSASNQYGYFTRAYTEYNTSALPDTCTISSAVSGYYGHTTTTTVLGSTSFGITGFTPTTNGTAVKGDYQTFGNVIYSDTFITSAGWSTSDNNTYTWNAAGIANISKTGYTNIMLRFYWDIYNDVTGLGWTNGGTTKAYYQQSEHSGTADPYIQITYTTGGGEPDTTPPASITSFSNNKNTCTEQTVTWTNPVDADFASVMVYQDNVWHVNETGTSHAFTGLNSWQSYTYSTKTQDATGNINATWVNQTIVASPICKIITYIRQFYLLEGVI